MVTNTHAADDKIELRLGITDYRPHGYMGKNGECIGFNCKVVKFLFDEVGIKWNYRFYPYSRLIEQLSKGQIDIAIGAPTYYLPELKKNIIPGLFLYNASSVLFGFDTRKQNIADFKGIQVSTMIGLPLNEAFEKAGIKLTKTSSSEAALKMLYS